MVWSACVVALLAAAGGSGPGTGAAAGRVDSLFVSTSGSDSNPCSAAAPCQSFDRAYRAARPGQVVEVAAGTYPGQRVGIDAAKPPTAEMPNVVFRPAAGAAVSLSGSLTVTGSHVEFHDMAMSDWYAGQNTSSIPQTSQTAFLGFYGITAQSFVVHASNVNVVGGSYGPVRDAASVISDCYQCDYSPQHVTVDGVYFHDYVRVTPGIHMECLHVFSASYLTVRNSRFYNCAIMDLFIDNFGSSPNMHDILVENNFFDEPGSHGGSLSDGSYSLYLGQTGRSFSNVTIRNNTSLATMYVETRSPVSNVSLVGNLGSMPSYQCIGSDKGVSYSHDVWWSGSSSPARCGPTDRALAGGIGAVRFANPDAFDLHLELSSPAVGSGDAASSPHVDIDRQARPLRMAPDAGADQQEPASLVLGRAIGGMKIGSLRSAVTAVYGSPLSTRRVALGKRAPRVSLDRYRRRGGTLWIAYDDDKAVALGTTSPYYTTAAGFGVSMSAADPSLRSALGRPSCPTTYRRRVGGVLVSAAVRGSRVQSVSMIVPRYAGRLSCPRR